MLEDARVCFIFEKVHYGGLQVQIEALKASITTGTAVSYTTAANHLSTAFSQFKEYTVKNRVISGVEACGTSDVIHDPNGRIIFDRWIPNWGSLSNEDRKKVMSENKRLGISVGKGGKVKKVGIQVKILIIITKNSA